MTTCNDIREQIAINPEQIAETMQAHIAECAACARYRRSLRTLDPVLKAEMHWEVPAALTARLLALTVVPPPVIISAPPKPQPWYVSLIGALTVAVVAISVAIAWQLMGAVATQFGLLEALAELAAWPGRALAMMTDALPQSRYAIDFFMRVREQLTWMLLIIIVWLAIDQWRPQLSVEQRRIHS
jgi:hypothetical protein